MSRADKQRRREREAERNDLEDELLCGRFVGDPDDKSACRKPDGHRGECSVDPSGPPPLNFLQGHYNRAMETGISHVEYVIVNDLSDGTAEELMTVWRRFYAPR